MGLILSLETTTTNCSVAIGENGKLLVLKENNSNQYSHAEKLHVYIEEALKEANLKFSDLDAIAVSKGPGSYTGLRIGVSAAKGLCFSLDIPLISIDTLESLAKQVSTETEQADFIIPLLDARRMEVYTATFDTKMNSLSSTEAKILDENSYTEFLNKGKTIFIGNAVKKFEDVCAHKNATFTEALPSAKEMIGLAESKHKKSDTEDVTYFEPYYLKDFLIKK